MTSVSGADHSSAAEILEQSPSLANLSKTDKDALKKVLGDFETDAAAAELAADVVEHIERYEEDGSEVEDADDSIGDGTIDGWTRADRTHKDSEAEHGTEARRFQDFLKYGFERLKGGKFDGKAPKSPVADPEAQVNRDWFEAVQDGDVETVRDYLARSPEGWDVDVQDENGLSELHWAALGGKNGEEMVGVLVDEGRIDMALIDDSGDSAYGRVLDYAEGYRDGEAAAKPKLEPIVSFLERKLDGEAVAAMAHGDGDRLDQLTAAGAEKPRDPADIAAEHDITPIEGVNIMSLRTTQKEDPDDDDSPGLTVSAAATKNLIDGYKEKIEDGELEEDGKEAKLVRALEAKAALANGRSIIPYEEDGSFGGTWREFGDPVVLTGADHEDIIDAGAVDAAIGEAFADRGIMGDYDAEFTAAAETIENRDRIVADLESTLTGDKKAGYDAYLEDLTDAGLSDAAQMDVAARQETLAALDPEKGKAAKEKMLQTSIAAELDAILSDPDGIDQDTEELASNDIIAVVQSSLGAAGATAGLPANLAKGIDTLLEEIKGDKVQLGKFVEALDWIMKSPDGTASAKDIETIAKDVYRGWGDSSGTTSKLGKMIETLTKGLNALNKKGMLGSISSAAGLVSGVYKLAGQGGELGDEPLERMAIAKDFIQFVGQSPNLVTAANSVANKLTGGATVWLGLDKSMSEIWGTGDGSGGKPSGAPTAGRRRRSASCPSSRCAGRSPRPWKASTTSTRTRRARTRPGTPP